MADQSDPAPTGRSPIDGNMLPDDIFIPDDNLGSFPFEFFILRGSPNGDKGGNPTVFTDSGITVDIHMGPNLGAGINESVSFDNGVGADRDIFAHLGVRANNSRWMDGLC